LNASRVPGSVRNSLRKSEQSPTPATFPFLLESGTLLFEEFALGRIVQQHKLTLRVQSGDDHIVKRHKRPRLQSRNQGAALFQVLLQICWKYRCMSEA
jgi:hypothetical protein